MHTTEGMEQVKRGTKPHTSHRMTTAESVIVSCASNERFGALQTCKACKGKFIVAGQGTYLDERLQTLCRKPKTRKPKTFKQEFDQITRVMAEGQLQSAARWRGRSVPSDRQRDEIIASQWDARAEATNEIRKRLGFEPIKSKSLEG